MLQTTAQTLKNYSNFDELLNDCRNIFSESSTFSDWLTMRDYLINNEENAKAAINKAKIDQLSRYTRKDKKGAMVDNIFSSLLSLLNLGDSIMYQPFSETYKQAFERITSKYTESDFLAYRQQKIDQNNARKKALLNPETLEEFKTFIYYRGEKALTDEQRIKYDELRADNKKQYVEAQEEKKAEVKKVDGVSCEIEIKETVHTKKNIPLFVAVLSQRVERSVYEELNKRAKKLGGYYSSYNKGGAIAGFIFENREAAELFAKVKDSDVNASEIKAEQKEEKQQTAAEALRAKGEKFIYEGEEELNRDRKDNTHRRAAMAASAEKAASEKIAFGKKLVKISEAMEAGEIKYLDKLRTASDLETLQSVLNAAKYRHMQAENIRREEYEPNEKTAFYIQMPYPTLYSGAKTDLLKMQEFSNGKKLAAGRMLKRFTTDANGNEFLECTTAQALEDYATLFCQLCPIIKSWEVRNHTERLMHIKRLQRMGIDDIHSLRAAIMELLNLGKGAKIDPEQAQKLKVKELERKYIGAKISGFFPTPEELTNNKIELLDIQDGNTILEPSAGLGHMADAVRAAGFKITCVEIHTGLCEVLKAKGHTVINEDFLTHTGKYDRIIMNPPFENLQDIDHVKHAYSLLNDGGKLVATMANNKQRKPDFIEWVNERGYMEENPAGSFTNSFNPTGVSTITVFLTK